MSLESRVDSLEKIITLAKWEDIELRIYVEDCSPNGNDESNLLAITKSGNPGGPGKSYYRWEDEAEAAFLERVTEAEVRR